MDTIANLPANVTNTIACISRENEIKKILYGLHFIVPSYVIINDVVIDYFAKKILERSPEFNPEKLRFVLRQYEDGKLKWDKDKFVQNIIEVLYRVRPDVDGFRLSEVVIRY